MTVIEKSTWTGLPIDAVRPGARVRMGTQLQTIAEDQAFNYKTMTGLEVDNAPSSDVATNHIHDGTTGPLIPFPAQQQMLNAWLNTGDAVGAYVPLVFTPVFCPPGHTSYNVTVWTKSPSYLMSQMKVSTFTSALVAYAQGGAFYQIPELAVGGYAALVATVATTADAVNLFKIEAWDGATLNDDTTAVIDRDVKSYAITPNVGAPYPVRPHNVGIFESNDVAVPTTTQHLGSEPFSSINTQMLADDRGVSSYVVQACTLNDALLFERGTGQPAGNRSAVTYEGHGHGGGTAPATAADNQGAEIDHQLGAWFYGVARQMPGGGLSQMVHDQTNPVSPANNDSWTGRIFGPTVTTGSTWLTVAEHHVRLPEGPDASFAHSSGKVDFVALVYGEDYAPSSPTHQLRVSLLDTSFSAGTTQTAAVAVTGLQLITITGIDASGSSPGESEQILRVEMNSNLNGSQSMFLYGCALYFNA